MILVYLLLTVNRNVELISEGRNKTFTSPTIFASEISVVKTIAKFLHFFCDEICLQVAEDDSEEEEEDDDEVTRLRNFIKN